MKLKYLKYVISGKGDSIWDVHANTKGAIANNDNGNISCDSYHKYMEDVKILKNLGVNVLSKTNLVVNNLSKLTTILTNLGVGNLSTLPTILTNLGVNNLSKFTTVTAEVHIIIYFDV